tara:strand:- start:247 stop:630 length:384 start_codon:yes stop_codon:yes gene_type:complete
MKKLTLMLLCGLAILTGTVSLHAQEQTQTFKLPTFIDCGTKEAIDKLIGKYNEIPFATGEIAVIIPPGNQMIQGPMTMYIDPVNGSYTMTMTLEPREGWPNPFNLEKCIISYGKNFKPASIKKETQI